MYLFEGAKVSQKLINEAFQDEAMTLGFEAEFFITGIQSYLEGIAKQGTKREQGSGWLTKKLGDLTWYDVMLYFEPLSIAQGDDRDDQEVIKSRLKSVHNKLFPEDSEVSKLSEMWAKVRDRYKPSHLITLMKINPRFGFVLDAEANAGIERVLRRGMVPLMINAYKELDKESFRLFERGYESDILDIESNMITREMVYDLIAEQLSEYLGEPVLATLDPYAVKQATGGYQTYALTMDESLSMDDYSDTIGVELISPVKQAAEGREGLMRVMQMIQNFGRIIPGVGAETNEKTGLHINIGVRGREVDFVKLLFLMGDQYVAQNWMRLQYRTDNADARVYAAQTYYEMIKAFASKDRDIIRLLDRLEQNITLTPEDIQMVVDMFRRSVRRDDKHFSVNLSKLDQGFVEFRTPGNTDYHKKTGLLSDTVNHLGVMMHVATNPQVYRQEFLKKLYRVATTVGKQYLEQSQQDINYPRTMQRVGYDTDTQGFNQRVPQMAEKAYFCVVRKDDLRGVMTEGLYRKHPRDTIRLFEDWDTMEHAVLEWLDMDGDLSLVRVRVEEGKTRPDGFYPGHEYIGGDWILPRQIDVIEVDL